MPASADLTGWRIEMRDRPCYNEKEKSTFYGGMAL